MDRTDAQSPTSEVGGKQDAGAPLTHDPNGLRTAEREGGESGAVGGRFRGDDRTFGTAIILGGILGQLIKDAEHRLAETEECVAWYQREAEKAKERLTELRSLQSQIQE